MTKDNETAVNDTATDKEIEQFMDHAQPRQAPQSESATPDSSWTDVGRLRPGELSERSPQSAEPVRPKRSELTKSIGKQQKDGDEYYRRFLQSRKVKDYAPVYIDVRMKEKLSSLIASLQHLAPDVTPTMLLSNILADHISANKDLIQQVAREGLKRSLENTFNDNKD